MKTLSIGLDIGSTTLKCVVLDEKQEILYQSYERHQSQVRKMSYEKIKSLSHLLSGNQIQIAVTGSAGMGVASAGKLLFVQEVFACAKALNQYNPQCDLAIELGGEDAKIIFLQGTIEERMNSSCAGGTGAFIDQMASLLNIDIDTFDKLSLQAQRIYPIASRCGVFAKSDIQPLINQGAKKADMAMSIYQAVVDQTIGGLAQGRKLEGTIAFLGGPLTFLKGLQQCFVKSLKLDETHAIFPEGGQYYIAIGAALHAMTQCVALSYEEVLTSMANSLKQKETVNAFEPLFQNEEEYQAFVTRHQSHDVGYASLVNHTGSAYLGIDAGSTTTKLVLINDRKEILYQHYQSNHGQPLDVVQEQLMKIYDQNPHLQIVSSAVTGYGEDLIKEGFQLDHGLVETMAHYEAACYFNPEVDFILDIGGQDMKCFKIKDHAIDEIILNEACSSGCGSFLETFAHSLQEDIDHFSKQALFAKHPVQLGSRCTVFMNSSVKEAQKNGASIADISAGLAMSVVKNALYKVIRLTDKDEIGQCVVVQGGTFLNDAVLRCFEMELGREVIRPSIAGLMGAFGAALYAQAHMPKQTQLLSIEQIVHFTHQATPFTCQGCTNHCHLTMNRFNHGIKQIAGNRCDFPVSGTKQRYVHPNLYQYKLELLKDYPDITEGRLVFGLPKALNGYENYPFYYHLLRSLGFGVVGSDESDKKMQESAWQTIPSDTVCFPAKLMHGHVQNLLDKKVDQIFYPCITYNFDEGISDNHFNCPIVAYYPQVIASNMDVGNHLFSPFLALDNPRHIEIELIKSFRQIGIHFTYRKMRQAVANAYAAYEQYKKKIIQYGQKAIQYAREHHLDMLVLCGRPYHIDPYIHHGISDLLTSLNWVVLTEDSLSDMKTYEKRDVLNQWTYHARMYNAASVVAENEDMQLCQLVSFGCGIDAITSDEIKAILQAKGKLYTQIKIDETSNLGAVKIRLRSLAGALEKRKEEGKHV